MNEFKEGFLDALKKDYRAGLNGKTDIKSKVSCVLFNRGVHCLFFHRLQVCLRNIPVVGMFLSKLIWYFVSCIYACEISDIAKIAGGVYIPHPIGIVIGDGVVIESGVHLHQQVTIGTKSADEKGYPIIRSGVYLGAGAKILGDIEIGENSKVGANSVVLKSVLPDKVVVGVPAREASKFNVVEET